MQQQSHMINHFAYENLLMPWRQQSGTESPSSDTVLTALCLRAWCGLAKSNPPVTGRHVCTWDVARKSISETDNDFTGSFLSLKLQIPFLFPNLHGLGWIAQDQDCCMWEMWNLQETMACQKYRLISWRTMSRRAREDNGQLILRWKQARNIMAFDGYVGISISGYL